MKILMICNTDLSSNESLGVVKKVKGQYSAFSNLGCDTYLACLNNGNAVLNQAGTERIIVERKNKFVFTVFTMFKKIPNIVKEEKIDVCFIRYPLADWAFIKMLKQLYRISTVVVEMPTFPYDQQASNNKNIVSQFNFFQDMHYRKYLKRYVKCFVTYGDQETIYDVKCIKINNGIDVSSVKYLGDKLIYNKDINLIAVARVQRDHGYDRIIEGMKVYYDNNVSPKVKINLHIVGSGEAESELKKLVMKYSLSQYVYFHGVKTGNELEKLYLSSQIGVGFLGIFRSGLNAISALKNKEYCAVGIPIFGSAIDNSIPVGADYYKMIQNDDSPVNMNDIIQFFDYIKKHPEMHSQMRNLAENELSWEKQLQIVINELLVHRI